MRLLATTLVAAVALVGWAQNPPTPPSQQQQPPAGAQPPTPPAPALTAPQAPVITGTVIIDPGHGGTDAGARGEGGILEKDVVMSLAQSLRSALEKQGLRVVLTRQANENPSYDDRAATANAYRSALVVALHVSSTGVPGTARAYFPSANSSFVKSVIASDAKADSAAPPQKPVWLVRWEEAQQSHVATSKKFAEAVQAQIKQRLEKSQSDPAQASLRDLRSVAGPAIAVELASVSVKDRKTLDPALAPLAEAIAKGVAIFRGAGEPGKGAN